MILEDSVYLDKEWLRPIERVTSYCRKVLPTGPNCLDDIPSRPKRPDDPAQRRAESVAAPGPVDYRE